MAPKQQSAKKKVFKKKEKKNIPQGVVHIQATSTTR
jgi:ribosomal protein S11